MALDRLNDDLNIVQALDDEPNDVGGLTAGELKAKFDAAGLVIKDFLNNTLLPQLEAAGVLSLIRHGSDDCKYIRLNGDGAIEVSGDGAAWSVTGSSGHKIYDKDGNFVAQRARMKFANSVVTDDGTYTVVNGIKGDKGDKGDTGETGRTATLSIGTVTTGAEGSAVVITNAGTAQDAVWNISIPKGDKGAAWYPTLDSLGNLTFALTDTSTPPPSYNIRGPQGPQGVQGLQGAAGSQGPQGIQGPVSYTHLTLPTIA